MIRDLVRIRCCIVFRSRIANSQTTTAGSPTLPVPRKQIFGYLPASGFRTTLTQIPLWCLFLVALLGALFSASCQLPLILLCRELDC